MGDGGQSSSSASTASNGGGMLSGFNQRNGKVHSSFRITPLVEMLGTFSADKEKVIKKMRFDGLLHLPRDESVCERPFKLKFAFNLLMKLDSETSELDLGQGGRLPMSNDDVNLVFGLPSCGEEIKDTDASKLEKNRDIIKKNLLLESGEELDLQTVKKVLARDILGDADGPLAKAFMTAVAIYCVSCFLAPKGRPPKINTEIFAAISDPDNIVRVNWSSYVLKTLRESPLKVKADIASGNSSVCLDGCLLFVQILYLDNIDLGIHSTSQYRWPRVADFSYARLKELISMDKRKGGEANGWDHGTSELRHPAESFYTVGMLYRRRLQKLKTSDAKLRSDADLNKVLAYIDADNDEHKRNIWKQLISYGEELCRINDRHCEGVKNIVSRWKSVWKCKEKEPDNEELGGKHTMYPGYFQYVPEQHRGARESRPSFHETAETSRKRGSRGKISSDGSKPKDVEDLSGSDDEATTRPKRWCGKGQDEPGQQPSGAGVHRPQPTRHCYKVPVSRTLLAIRRPKHISEMDEDEYFNNAYEQACGPVMSRDVVLAIGEHPRLLNEQHCRQQKTGRTKHVAKKKNRGKGTSLDAGGGNLRAD